MDYITKPENIGGSLVCTYPEFKGIDSSGNGRASQGICYCLCDKIPWQGNGGSSCLFGFTVLKG